LISLNKKDNYSKVEISEEAANLHLIRNCPELNEFAIKNNIANILLQQSGAYDTISVQLTNAIMTGLSFFIVFFLLGIVAYIVRHIIRKIERVPVIGTVNRIAGFAVGFIKGMVIVWLLLALTSLFAASEIGQTMTAYINDSMMLKYLYENNPVIKLIENIL
jgi:uncharacterized membrane protein required for colicin V production